MIEAPASARAQVICKPIPPVPPVTMAVLLDREKVESTEEDMVVEDRIGFGVWKSIGTRRGSDVVQIDNEK